MCNFLRFTLKDLLQLPSLGELFKHEAIFINEEKTAQMILFVCKQETKQVLVMITLICLGHTRELGWKFQMAITRIV